MILNIRFLLFMNFGIACAYLLLCVCCTKDRISLRTCVIRYSIMCICPVVGICFFVGSYLIDKLFFRIQPSLNDVIFEKSRVKTQLQADERSAKNIVSLEESLSINQPCDLRSVMMTTIKKGGTDTLSVIAQGLDSDDSEVMHYTASYLMDETDRFRAKVLSDHKSLTSGQDGIDLINHMNRFLDPVLFTDSEYRKFVLIMWDVLRFVFDKTIDKTLVLPECCECVFVRLLEVNELSCSEECLNLLRSYFPGTSEYYTCSLRFCYKTGNRDLFFNMLSQLKQSDIQVDHDMLEVIRFFDNF